MVFIYILELENSKYYIGKTHNPNFRLDAHFNSIGSSWTKKYKPIKLLKLIPNCSDFDEDKYTKEYMLKKGINNVRGGTYLVYHVFFAGPCPGPPGGPQHGGSEGCDERSARDIPP